MYKVISDRMANCEIQLWLQLISAMQRKYFVHQSLTLAIIMEYNVLVIEYR